VRDPKRINRIINQLKGLWMSHPDLRFFQLVEIMRQRMGDAIYLETGKLLEDLFYIEDEDLLDKWDHVADIQEI
jgi:hypothetical protein